MEDKVRNIRPQFVERCNLPLLQELLDDLAHIKILSYAEVEYIREGSSERREKCRTLIDIVIKKGDLSCKMLLQKIREKDPPLSEALGITETLPLPTQEENRSGAQPIPPEINGITLCTEEEYQRIKAEETENYPICKKNKRKRLALIICNINFDEKNIGERKGAQFDLTGMKELLEGLDYNVQWKKNLTAAEMRTTMKNFAADTDHKDSDSTFLVFMSHGERGFIYGTDFKREKVEGQERVTGDLRVDDIYNTFNNKNCSGLRDKPKMIIIQACRGEERSRTMVSDGAQPSQSIQQNDLEDDAGSFVLKETDFICFYSTTPDTVSFRDPASGSLFIQQLISDMKKDAHNSPVQDIFQKVQRSFQQSPKNRIQMPTQERNTLLKKFFLCPGY
ncbi:caspase-1-B-like isoform 2-T2 [Anomaloglossus baeobatrachus]|uniref:caspase-1-B-like isoform X2 n=1 Tax=Anomaloglossus baeobatrachus TaxID=238106 RepID=UPI003F501BBC